MVRYRQQFRAQGQSTLIGQSFFKYNKSRMSSTSHGCRPTRQSFPHPLEQINSKSVIIVNLYQILHMNRQQGENQQQQNQQPISEENNSDQENWDQEEREEVFLNDSIIQLLNESIDKLRKFVAEIPIDQIDVMPPCISEYCQNISKYMVEKRQKVILMAQKRIKKMVRNRKIKHNWNSDDLTLLVWLISQRIQLKKYSHFSELIQQDWEFISEMISGSTWQKCKFKWLSLKRVKLVNHKWTKLQSNLLGQIISQLPVTKWKVVSEALYQRNLSINKVFRTAKQCREHWTCFLNPNIQKGPWTSHQDQKLLDYVHELEGSKKWSQIAKFMEGRTQNALKNRFHLLIDRQRKLSGHLTEKRLIKICLNRLMQQNGHRQKPLVSFQSSAGLTTNSNKKSQSPGAQSVNTATSIMPTIPTVVPSTPSFQNQINFSSSSEHFMAFFRGSFENMGNNMMTSSIDNGMVFGFIFPNQF